MQTSAQATAEGAAQKGHRLAARSRTDRVVAGVAAGIAERLQIDPVVVRLSFVVFTAAGGVGVVAYIVGWLVLHEDDVEDTAGPRSTTTSRQAFAVAMIDLGALLLLRLVGLWFGDAIVWPIALGAFGSGVLWVRSDESGRERWARVTARIPGGPIDPFSGGVSPARLVGGGLLIAAGMGGFLAANDALPAARTVGLAVLVLGSGVALIFGPWVARLAREASEERRERIRSEERSEMAAHLHDSVLQTLALIQRAPDPREMSTLARLQERELRSWLYGRTKPSLHDSFHAAIENATDEVERLHRVPINTVIVGDTKLDDKLSAIVDACREAAVNAAKHAGAGAISVYAEVTDDTVTCFIRDQGSGFDRTLVPDDRRGIVDSIEGRMLRYGGKAEVVTAPGSGTEIRLTMPRSSDG